MESVYLETTIIGYLAMRRSKDLIIASNQQLTHQWWTDHRSQYDLLVSQPVIDECKAGDPIAAAERLVFLQNVRVLNASPDAYLLADDLLHIAGLPRKAEVDALHIAIAAINGADYLLTWNCTHIANPSFRRKMEEVLANRGVDLPIICTPQELIGE